MRSSGIRPRPKHRRRDLRRLTRHAAFKLQPIRVDARLRVPFGLGSLDVVDPACKIDRRQTALPFSRKEVIQPHLPIRLPCYDFTPVTNPAVVIAPLAVRLTTSGRTRSHGVTGGVYKTRERIHRGKLIRDY